MWSKSRKPDTNKGHHSMPSGCNRIFTHPGCPGECVINGPRECSEVKGNNILAVGWKSTSPYPATVSYCRKKHQGGPCMNGRVWWRLPVSFWHSDMVRPRWNWGWNARCLYWEVPLALRLPNTHSKCFPWLILKAACFHSVWTCCDFFSLNHYTQDSAIIACLWSQSRAGRKAEQCAPALGCCISFFYCLNSEMSHNAYRDSE